jgi:hypothetical protein
MLTVPLAARRLFGLRDGRAPAQHLQPDRTDHPGRAWRPKNGILIVEFANQLRDEGLSVGDAVDRAARSPAARSS